MLGAPYAHQVLERKYSGEAQFQLPQQVTVSAMDMRNGVNHDRKDAGENDYQERNIKSASRWGVGPKNDDF